MTTGIHPNDRVTVVLTARGAKLLNDGYAEMRRTYPKVSWTFPERVEGEVYATQLWCLMRDMGGDCLGFEVPFTDLRKVEP